MGTYSGKVETNLLAETIEALTQNGRIEAEVLWVGNEQFRCSWEEFVAVAKDEMYDSGFGGAEIATDLLVVGKDFWLERHEYDGSEWWEFKEQPQMPDKEFKPTTFKAMYGSSLNSIIKGDYLCLSWAKYFYKSL